MTFRGGTDFLAFNKREGAIDEDVTEFVGALKTIVVKLNETRGRHV